MYLSPPIIEEVGKILRQQIPYASEDRDIALIELDAFRFPVAEARCKQLKLLHEKRKQMLFPKDFGKGLTELDRTTSLNSDVAVIEQDLKLLEAIEGIVEGRLGLLLTLSHSNQY